MLTPGRTIVQAELDADEDEKLRVKRNSELRRLKVIYSKRDNCVSRCVAAFPLRRSFAHNTHQPKEKCKKVSKHDRKTSAPASHPTTSSLLLCILWLVMTVERLPPGIRVQIEQ